MMNYLLTGLNSVECYDPEVKEWRTIANMSTRRSSVGVAVVRGNGKYKVESIVLHHASSLLNLILHFANECDW